MISLPQVTHVFLGAPLVCLDWEVVQFETLRPLFWDGRPGGHRWPRPPGLFYLSSRYLVPLKQANGNTVNAMRVNHSWTTLHETTKRPTQTPYQHLHVGVSNGISYTTCGSPLDTPLKV